MKNLLLTCILLVILPGIALAQDRTGTLYIFLAKDCPICQYYTLELKSLHETYSSKGIEFVGVFSVPQASRASIEAFQQTYQIPFKLILDIDQQLMQRYRVTVTPEVVLVNKEKEIIYQGRIDDTYIQLGRRKRSTPHKDLELALEAYLQKKEIPGSRTQPVGCFITPIQK